MTEPEKYVMVAGIIGLSICVLMYVDKRGQPRWQDNFDIDTNLNSSLLLPDGFEHYFHPGMACKDQKLVYTPHRYPVSCGGQITTLIHRGFDAMRKPAPQDSDWMFQPPSEATL
jgi:hypothetical protein